MTFRNEASSLIIAWLFVSVRARLCNTFSIEEEWKNVPVFHGPLFLSLVWTVFYWGKCHFHLIFVIQWNSILEEEFGVGGGCRVRVGLGLLFEGLEKGAHFAGE